MAKHNEIGKIGENIAKTFLMKQGFDIKDINYRTKYGEIDIVCLKDKVIHFIEVKSIKVFNFNTISDLRIRPEDNFTKEKGRKFKESVFIYLKHKNIEEGVKFQIDLVCVYVDEEIRQGKVKVFENV